MEVHDAEIGLVLLLKTDPVADGAQVVAEVEFARGLYAAEYALPAIIVEALVQGYLRGRAGRAAAYNTGPMPTTPSSPAVSREATCCST